MISLWANPLRGEKSCYLFLSPFFFFNGDPYLSPQQPKGLTSENNECIKKRALSLSSFLSPSRWPCLQVASKCFWERLLRLRIRWLWVIGSCYETLVTTPLPLLGSHDNNNDDDDDYNEDDDLHVIQSNYVNVTSIFFENPSSMHCYLINIHQHNRSYHQP